MNTKPRELARLFAAGLKERRLALGLRQGDLAGLARISVHSLSNIESGRANPSLEVLESLLDCLGLAVRLVPRESEVPGSGPDSKKQPL
jgi:transcriptional regulator with XRE-family HTH domain